MKKRSLNAVINASEKRRSYVVNNATRRDEKGHDRRTVTGLLTPIPHPTGHRPLGND